MLITEANIKAGVDMRKIEIMSIEDNKISIKLPAIEIEEPCDMQNWITFSMINRR